MITGALWEDVNKDSKPDLILSGEWMPITLLIQDAEGHFLNKTEDYGLAKTSGWWNTVYGDDFDGDGDRDFVVGNLGWNSRLRATVTQPVTLFVGDIDANGGTDHLLTYYNQGEQHPFISRDQLVKQVPSFKRDFLKYNTFRKVRREHIIPMGDSAKYLVLRAQMFNSVYLENRSGRFVVSPLPTEAQAFPVFAFSSGDFNHDGHIDLLAAGNLFAVQPDFGRYDAGYGLMMTGDGKGGFDALPLQSSGFVVSGEARAITRLKSATGADIVLVARNNDAVLVFR
jgi:hypothetical protein